MVNVILLDGELETVGEDGNYVVIWRLRERSGGGGVGVEDFLGLFVGKFEVGAVIFEKVQVVFHG